MKNICPRCGDEITTFPALSRFDNETDICSECGTREAFYNLLCPGRPLPPVDESIVLAGTDASRIIGWRSNR